MAAVSLILQRINDKEAELRRRIEAAERQAQAQLQTAQQEAEQCLRQAEAEARREAEWLYQQGIEAAQREAQAIVKAAQERAAAQQQVERSLPHVASHIVALVWPAGSGPAQAEANGGD
jgi:vacuolar-type H+-ATPase subunit H